MTGISFAAQTLGASIRALSWLETARARGLGVSLSGNQANRYRLANRLTEGRVAVAYDKDDEKLFLLVRVGGEMEWMLTVPWKTIAIFEGYGQLTFQSEPYEVEHIVAKPVSENKPASWYEKAQSLGLESYPLATNSLQSYIVDLDVDPDLLGMIRLKPSMGTGMFRIDDARGFEVQKLDKELPIRIIQPKAAMRGNP